MLKDLEVSSRHSLSANPGFAEDSHTEEFTQMQRALSLLEITGEAELDLFMARLLNQTAFEVGRNIQPRAGKMLRSMLKNIARKILPMFGRPVVGGREAFAIASIGRRMAGSAGRLFGIEMEGLSPEDQEYEVARRFVRFAQSAAKTAVWAPQNQSALSIARMSAAHAAKRHAPGLLPIDADNTGVSPTASRGRWIRSGRRIIVNTA